MKVLFILLLFLGLFQSSFAQESIQKEAISVIMIVDSIIVSIDKTKLIEKLVYGSVEPFSAVRGIAFLNREGTEIRKVKLTSLATQAEITYYCINNDVQVIVSKQALYYKHNNQYFVCHFIKETELFSEQQLQSQNEFLKNLKEILIK